MASYYVNDNQQPNGDHGVHREGSSYMPSVASRTYFGDHATCAPAVVAAKQL